MTSDGPCGWSLGSEDGEERATTSGSLSSPHDARGCSRSRAPDRRDWWCHSARPCWPQPHRRRPADPSTGDQSSQRPDRAPAGEQLAHRSPEALSDLPVLTRLDLSSNQLTAVPEAIGNLTALHWLGLFDNRLTALPEAIGNLTALDWLGLFGNQLTAVPDTIGNLTSLDHAVAQRQR